MNEEFKYIPDSRYQIGSRGSVLNPFGRFVQRQDSSGVRHENTRITTLNGHRQYVKINELVMAAFGEERPSDHHQIMHRDDDITNCSIDNLSWVLFKYGKSQLLPSDIVEEDPRSEEVRHRFDNPNSIYDYF